MTPKTKRLIGWTVLISLFLLLFGGVAWRLGSVRAAAGFLGSVAFASLVVLAVNLISPDPE